MATKRRAIVATFCNIDDCKAYSGRCVVGTGALKMWDMKMRDIENATQKYSGGK